MTATSEHSQIKFTYITRTSQFSGITRTLVLRLSQEQLDNYQKGMLPYLAFPQLTPLQRMFVDKGLTEDEWDKITEEWDKMTEE